MKGWRLEDVQALTPAVYEELVQWIQDEADREKHGNEPSIDMDEWESEDDG